MSVHPVPTLDDTRLPTGPGRLLLALTEGRERPALTELMARLALRGPFDFIAAGEWVPGRIDLQQAVRRRTPAVHAALDRLQLTRPTTYLQLLDLLAEAGASPRLLLVLDLFHLFYVQDVTLAQRLRVLEACCAHLRRIKRLRPAAVFVQRLPVEDFEQFLPLALDAADEVLYLAPPVAQPAAQLAMSL
jgi:hypothetical protein